MTVATKSRPIIMSAESVRAILDGRKTQTRRVVKYPIPADADEVFIWPEGMRPLPHHKNPGLWARKHNAHDDATDGWIRFIGACRYGVPGDLLYVKESFITGWPTERGDVQYCDEDGNNLPEHLWCRADYGHFPTDREPMRYGCRSDRGAFISGWDHEDGGYQDNIPWKSSLFMPRDAARLWLRVVKVRVERVQNISWRDMRAEGIVLDPCQTSDSGRAQMLQDDFRDLWDSLNAKRDHPWSNNDWVWAVTFERTEKPAA